MEFQDYYKILGISKNASPDEIHRAYRKLARKYHPDVNKSTGSEEYFKKINEAHDVLKDPERRKLYDIYGRDWQNGGPQRSHRQESHFSGGTSSKRHSGPFRFDSNGGFRDASGFGDFFESLFGGEFDRDHGEAGAGPGAMSGRKHEAELTVSLSDVCNGAVKTVSLQTYETDESGRIEPVEKTLQVKIPRGVTEGGVIRLAGQGEKGGRFGASKDLLLRIHIAPDPRFRVDGHDLHTVVAVSPWEAALGTKITLQTVDNSVSLTIPEGSQNGKKFRLRGKGIPRRKGPPGDIIVGIEVKMPEHLTDEEEELLREISEKSRFNPREKYCQKAGASN